MATYTDNYHLSKPETTDSQQSFIEDYATNMDIIDENMGGGSGGGHVIINENDTEMAQEPKMQFAGKVSVTDDSINEKTVVTLPEEVKEVTLAEYESIPVAERESNGIAYFIKDLNNSNVQGYPPLIYSDEEREVGVWRDGKPLYQKTIDVGMLPNRATKTVNYDVANVDAIVKIFGIGIASTGGCCPIPFSDDYSSSGNILLDANTSNGTIRLISQSDKSPFHGYITIQYTKTTDTAGSGIWNGQGGLAHHYSTSETVIGTWIDGKPLYEKTIHIGALTPTDNIVAHGIGNIERVINIKGYSDQGGRWFPLPYVQTQNLIGYQEKVYVDGTNVYVNLLNDDYISDCYVTIQYTKTTDV